MLDFCELDKYGLLLIVVLTVLFLAEKYRQMKVLEALKIQHLKILQEKIDLEE